MEKKSPFLQLNCKHALRRREFHERSNVDMPYLRVLRQ